MKTPSLIGPLLLAGLLASPFFLVTQTGVPASCVPVPAPTTEAPAPPPTADPTATPTATGAPAVEAAVTEAAVTEATGEQITVDVASTGFTPAAITVGTAPVTVRFRLTVSDCGHDSWVMHDSGDRLYVTSDSPSQRFAPTSNTLAGTRKVAISVTTDRFSFALKRRTALTFDASEPVTKGRSVKLKGLLRRADWAQGAYVGAANKPVQVQFRTSASAAYKSVKTVRTDADGRVATTATATRTGFWRLRFGGDSVSASSVSAADGVKVVNPPKPAPKPKPRSGCDPNYGPYGSDDGCVPIASDVDCAWGSGNGPKYFDGVAKVIGRDIYDLDRDDDGIACER